MIEAVVSGYATLDYVAAAGGEPAALGTSAARLVPGAWPRAGGAPLYAGAQLAALGVATAPLVTVGEDVHAAAYAGACAAAGLAADGIATIAGGRSTACLLIHHDDGSYRCFLDPGDSATSLGAAQHGLLADAALVVAAAGPPTVTAELLDRTAPHQKLAWIVKADGACFPPALATRLAARADLVFANATERGFVVAAGKGAPGRLWVETGGAEAVTIRGAGGAISLPVARVDVGDATGAGDSFAGQFLARWLRGVSVAEAGGEAIAAVGRWLAGRG